METRTKILSVEARRCRHGLDQIGKASHPRGVVYSRQPHRTAVQRRDAVVRDQLAVVNQHLQAMEFPAITEDDLAKIDARVEDFEVGETLITAAIASTTTLQKRLISFMRSFIAALSHWPFDGGRLPECGKRRRRRLRSHPPSDRTRAPVLDCPPRPFGGRHPRNQENLQHQIKGRAPMAKRTYDESLRRLLADEGGYSNHPSDPGGPTNFRHHPSSTIAST